MSSRPWILSSLRYPTLTALFLVLATAQVAAAGSKAVPTARLLLPHFLVETGNLSGTTTLFAVRNVTDEPVEIEIRYHETTLPDIAQVTPPNPVLGPRSVLSINIRDVAGLRVDADGMARGFVIIETTLGGAAIEGDFFQVTPSEDFATGDRLVDIDPSSVGSDLCRTFSIRYLESNVFDGGTALTLWFDDAVAPDAEDPVLTYTIYNESGIEDFSAELFVEEVSLRAEMQTLLALPDAPANGVIELALNEGRLGHVAAVMRALGRFSVGLEAACID